MVPSRPRLKILDGGHCYLDMWLFDGKLRVRRMPSALGRADLATLRKFLDEVAVEIAATNPDHDNVVQDPEE
jgi:hypothetical protein